MPERPGGFERNEIDDGFRALASARSTEDIDGLIDAMPVLRSPIFHAQLRQYRLTNMGEFQQNPEAYLGFMAAYDGFFTRLHVLANFAQSESEAEPQEGSPEANGQVVFQPYFASIQSALGSAVPAPDGPTFNPAADATRIAEEVARLSGSPTPIPQWNPMPGTSWSAVVVACGHCHDLRVMVHPYLCDIFETPSLLELLRSRALEWSCCPRCTRRTVLPLRTWISEQPSPSDPLAAICTLVRVRENEVIYRPPPGTVRKPEDDRILEIRLDMMLRQLKIEQSTVGSGVLTNSIAYSLPEVIWRIDQTSAATAGPVGYQDLMADLYQKLVSGLLNWQDAERLVRKTATAIGEKWPVEPAYPVGDLMKALVMNLFAEACAQIQNKPLGIRVAIAGLVAQCYTGLGELARARISLARARDLAATNSENPATTRALDDTEADILRAEGRYAEAERLRPKVQAREDPAHTDSDARLEEARNLQNQSIDLRIAGHLAEAIQILQSSLSILRAMAAEVSPSSPEVRYGLSGTLANLAFVYHDCAKNFDVLSAVAEGPLDVAKLPRPVLATLQQMGSPQRLFDMQQEMIDRVNPLLQSEFPDGASPVALRARAAALFREAILNAGDYEYLCIQYHALAEILLESGDFGGATKAAHDCLACSAHIRHYKFMAQAWWLLAGIDRACGNAPVALQDLKSCLEASLRDTIRSGSPPKSDAAAVGVEALRIAGMGADPLTAIFIAESAKAIPTSVSLMRALPLQGDIPSALKELHEQREILRLRSIWEPGADIDAQIATVNAAIEHERGFLAVRDPRAASWHDATYLEISRPESVRRLLAHLGPQTTFLGFVTQSGTLFVYAVWPAGQILESVPFPADVLVSCDPAKLGSLLLDPVATHLKTLLPDDCLIISPCPDLDAVPFGLLAFCGEPLCMRATISVVDGSGMFEACAARPVLRLRTAVLAGAPARPDTPELPQAAAEAESIAAELEAAGIAARPVLAEGTATVPALAARSQRAELIHFACHAAVHASGNDASLLLAPAPLAKDSGVLSEDRILTDLALKIGCHVNLAACRTSILGDEGAYFRHGLVNAFLVAGASSVLGTVWPLPDGPAAVFQAAYYEHLVACGSPAHALAATQRAAVRGELGHQLRQPVNFGGYLLHGVTMKAQETDNTL